MPQTTLERAARWPGLDQQAMNFLKSRGFVLRRDWQWVKPSPTYVLTNKEYDAILYLIEEWDFGGVFKYD